MKWALITGVWNDTFHYTLVYSASIMTTRAETGRSLQIISLSHISQVTSHDPALFSFFISSGHRWSLEKKVASVEIGPAPHG